MDGYYSLSYLRRVCVCVCVLNHGAPSNSTQDMFRDLIDHHTHDDVVHVVIGASLLNHNFDDVFARFIHSATIKSWVPLVDVLMWHI